MSKKANFKIIMVNSFKGGTGKSSLALAHCLYEWKRNEEREDTEDTEEDIYYSRIFYVDIDRLGTSMSYYLFPDEKKKPCYFDKYSKEGIDAVCNEVALLPYKKGGSDNDTSAYEDAEAERKSKSILYAVLLNPAANRRQNYQVQGRMMQHEKIANIMFADELVRFFKECMETKENRLFVIDCSPGLSELECRLLDKFYELQGDYALCVEEIYVTTFESGQIRKTIECLNACTKGIKRGNCDLSIVLNDIQNCIGATQVAQKNGEDFNVRWENVAGDILDKLSEKKNVKIRYKRYNEEQMKAGIVDNVTNLDNNIDAFMLSKEYRDGYIPIEDRKETE